MSGGWLRHAAIAVGVALLLGAGFTTCFERKQIEIPTPASAEARRNPYLALGRLLEAMGHEVRVLEGPGSLDELPPPGATLFLTSSRSTLTRRRAEPLLVWVRHGGHLVTTAQSTWNDEERGPDPLIDPLGLYAYRSESDEEAESDEETGSNEDSEPGEHEAADELEAAAEANEDTLESLFGLDVTDEEPSIVALAEFPGRAEPLAVRFLSSRYWAEPEEGPSFSVADEAGLHLLTVAHGFGRVTALTDDWFARNERIGRHDHAELLVRIVGEPASGAPVWIVTSERWDGLLSQILQHAAPAALSTVALLVAWLVLAARRFGPIASEPLPERRRWIEHLDAVGRFYWNRDRAQELSAVNRESLRKQLQRRHPGWGTLPEAERNERLGEACGLAASQVGRALDPSYVPSSEAAMVALVANMERIRASS